MNKLKYYINHLIYIMNSEKFKITFIAIILLNLYGSFVMDELDGFFYGIYSLNINTWFNMLLILFCTINSTTLHDYMEQNKFYIIRCNNKTIYNNIVIKNIIFINTFIILINLIIGLILILIKYSYYNNLEIGNYYYYNISNIIYFIFFIFRKIVFINLLVVIFIYIRKLFGKIIMNIALFTLIARIISHFYQSDTLIASFKNIHLFIGYYFGLFPYSSFSLEIACSLFIGILLTIFAFILYRFIIKFDKQVLSQ